MHKLFIGTFLAASLFSLNACNSKEPENDPTISTPVKETTAPVVNNPAIPVDTSKKDQVITTTTAQPVAAGMNPAHGQPGHRCDIAVGAPLNSPASKPAAPTTTQTITPAATPTATAQPVAAGMNPAHGQPGHRCDIAVGAPLNSPASKPAVTTTQTVTPAAKPATENNKPKEVINAIPVNVPATAPASADPVKKD